MYSRPRHDGATVQNFLNVCIVVAAFTVLFLAYRHFRTPSQRTVTAAGYAPAVGSRVPLPGRLRQGQDTLVFVVQEGCRFCEASFPFYKHVLSSPEAKTAPIVFLLPTPEAESRRYLASNDIFPADVRQDSLRDLKVAGTPTILQVDDSGKLERAWIGKLSPDSESQVQAAVESLK